MKKQKTKARPVRSYWRPRGKTVLQAQLGGPHT